MLDKKTIKTKRQKFSWPKIKQGDILKYEFEDKIYSYIIMLNNNLYSIKKMQVYKGEVGINNNEYFVGSCQNMTLIQNNGNVIRKEGYLK